jgi:transcriptional regulator with XRE-family HTH domain
MESINDRIKALRKNKGLSQAKLAEKIGMSQRMLSAIEVGDNKPTIDVLAKIATFYGVSADYLLFGSADKPTPSEMAILNEIREDKAVYSALMTRIESKKTISALCA